MANNSELGKSLSRYTSTYYQLRPTWIEQLDFYEPTKIGGTNGSILSRYLYRYKSEDDGDFAARSNGITQLNLIKHIIQFYISTLFSTEVEIRSEKYQDQINDFLTECNNRGESLMAFLKNQVCPNAFLHGQVDVFIDLPRLDTQPVSRLEEEAIGLRPYSYIVPCLNRVRWNIDTNYDYSYYQSRDVMSREISTQFNIQHTEQYKVWTKDTVITYDVSGKEMESIVNPYGFIPAVTMTGLPTLRFFEDKLGVSLVDGVIEIQREIMNTLSLIRQWNREQAFSILMMKMDDEVMGESPAEGESKEIGVTRALYMRGKNSDARFLTPDTKTAESMCQYIDQLIDRAFELMLIPSDANAVKSHTTGNGIKVAMGQLYDRIVDLAKSLEVFVRNLITVSLRVQGINPRPSDITVKWNTDFSTESFMTNVQQLMSLKAAMGDISRTAVAEYAKRVVSSELYPSQKMEQIESEIDKWSSKPVQPVASDAALNQKIGDQMIMKQEQTVEKETE